MQLFLSSKLAVRCTVFFALLAAFSSPARVTAQAVAEDHTVSSQALQQQVMNSAM